MLFAKSYVLSLIVFLGVDLLWLGVVARGFYARQLDPLLRENFNLWAAGGFYLFYVAGIVFFAVAPALADDSWRRAAVNGVFLGLLAYGTYDMTNLATLKGWPAGMSAVDILWGGALTAGTAVAGFLLTRVIAAG